ncbi:IS200/IS605 family transposase [Candidatus Peregrinibacteria bacterium]|nr:IS200/IS605 family transposase [Candidatus Peregrinibacteria bacterium]
METRLSSHGAYRHLYHLVWIPKYRHKVLVRGVETYVERQLSLIAGLRPDVEVVSYNVRPDHVHLIMVIPPKYAVSKIAGEIKADPGREIREKFEWIRGKYRNDVFWSPGFFSSTVGIDEESVRKYVEFQEKVDRGNYQLKLGF